MLDPLPLALVLALALLLELEELVPVEDEEDEDELAVDVEDVVDVWIVDEDVVDLVVVPSDVVVPCRALRKYISTLTTPTRPTYPRTKAWVADGPAARMRANAQRKRRGTIIDDIKSKKNEERGPRVTG